MLFYFKKKPLVFTAFVSEEYAFANAYSPITSTKKNIPKWWKNLPSGNFNWDTLTSSTTTKHCVGIINSFTSGFILPAWTEIAFNITPERWSYQSADTITELSFHANEQTQGFYKDYIFLKIHSPWVIECSEPGIDLMHHFPFYHFTEPREYITPNGIISPIKQLYTSNIFMFFKKNNAKIMIEQNDPLLHIIPITEKEYNIKTEVVSFSEYIKKASIISRKPNFFLNGVKVARIQKLS